MTGLEAGVGLAVAAAMLGAITVVVGKLHHRRLLVRQANRRGLAESVKRSCDSIIALAKAADHGPYEWSAALRTPDGTLRLVGAVEGDDVTRSFQSPARERGLEHYRAWAEYSPENLDKYAEMDAVGWRGPLRGPYAKVVFVRRPISPWEEVEL